MTLSFLLFSVLEIAVAVMIIVGLFNEQRLVNFEDKLFRFIKRRLFSKRNKHRRAYYYPSSNNKSSRCA